MTPDRWRRVQRLFDAVLSREVAERPRYLERVTADDPALRREIETLIRSLESASQFIDQPAFDLGDRVRDAPLEAGTRLGAYRLERLLGTGGVGQVYLAARADRAFEKKVAIKVIKRGMDTDELVRRFRSERQILAQLDHPNIAKLLDGGASDNGRPFLVMEYVDGVPLTAWCHEHDLPVRARLHVALAVCEAVDLAHRNMVVHRDLKPGNILVDRDGTPKLLDFGIAKLLDPTALPTTVLPTVPGLRAMTPSYASPEQFRGGVVTTATDVYSLGVVFYEMLTGSRPYDLTDSSAASLEQAVLRTAPRRASQTVRRGEGRSREDGGGNRPGLARRLAGDLDSILGKALEKEPEQRYPSVAELAADIRRHLDGRPVRARSATFGYRASRFVRRHVLAVSAATIVALLVASFVATLLVQRGEVLRQRDRAEWVSAFLIDLFEIPEPSRERGETVTARELLDKGARDARARLADQPGLQAEVLGTMGATYARLGLFAEAEGLQTDALALLEATYGKDDPAVVTAQHRMAALRLATDDYADAERLVRSALDDRRANLGNDHPDTVESLTLLARIRHAAGAVAEAEALFDEAIEQARTHGYDTLLVRTQFRRGLLARARGDVSAAHWLGEALAGAEAFWGEDHPEVARILVQLADLATNEDADRATALFERALAIQRKVYRAPHPDLAQALNNQGVFALDRGLLDVAEGGFQEALAVQRAVVETGSALEAIVLNNLGRVRKARGDLEAAASLYRQSLAMHTSVFGDAHEKTANVLNNLAIVRQEAGDLDEAAALLSGARATLVATYGADHARVAVVDNNLGQLALRQGDRDAAQARFASAASTLRDHAPGHPALPGVLQNLAGLADDRGDGVTAIKLYREALEVLTALGRDRSADAAKLFNNLAVNSFLLEAYAESASWARRALDVYEHLQESASHDRLRVRRIIVTALERQGQLREAEALAVETVDACRARWGDEGETCARYEAKLASLRTQLREPSEPPE